MRTYAPASAIDVLERLLDEPSLARGVVHHEVRPAIEARYGEWPALARPEAPGRAREARDRAAVHPPGRRDRGRARGRGRRGGDPHRVGQVAVLHGAGAPVAGGGSVGPRAVPVPHQGPRPGPGRGAVGARPRRRPRGLERRLRRRHARADPLGDPQGRAGRRDQPGHAPLGDPPPPHQVVPAVRAAAGHRHRRAPHVPRRVRQPRRQRAPAAAAAVRPLREPPRDRVLLGDDREPVRARRDARRAPRPDDRSQRRARRREAPAAGRSAGHRRVDRGAGLGADAGRALGAAVPPRRPPDRGLRAVPRVRRDHALEPARGAADGPRPALAPPRLPGGLPADRAALDRARAPRRRGPRGRQHQRPRAGRGHRGARRGGARRLPGLDRRDVAADGPRRAPGRRQHRDPRGVARARRPVRHPPPGVPAGQRAGGGAPRPRQPPRAARPPARGGVRAAVRAGRRVRSRAGGRAARLPGRGWPGPAGRRRSLVLELGELPGLGDLAPVGGARERRDHRHLARPAARAGRGRPVRRAGPRPRARDLHARVDPVPRGPARVGRAQGVRPQDRRRPLHVREPGRDPQAARRVRLGAGDRRLAGPRRGDGREPRDPVQEAQVHHRRERRLGPGRPPRDRAPDDGLLGDGRGRRRGLAA